MTTAIYEELDSCQRAQVRMFGALRADVDTAVDSYLQVKSPKKDCHRHDDVGLE